MKKLSNAQEAIVQAHTEGFDKPDYITSLHWALILSDKDAQGKTRDIIRILTDPLFWQALGKARGWKGGNWKPWAEDWFNNRMVGGDETNYWQSLP